MSNFTQLLADTLRNLWSDFAQQDQDYRDWITIDTSDLDPDSSVDLILAKTTTLPDWH